MRKVAGFLFGFMGRGAPRSPSPEPSSERQIAGRPSHAALAGVGGDGCGPRRATGRCIMLRVKRRGSAGMRGARVSTRI
jgi:hypothetical protein